MNRETKFIISMIIQIPIWFTGLYWGIYWIFNWMFSSESHPAESMVTQFGGSIIIIILGYAILWYIYGFLAYSFDLPKPFYKKV